MRPPARSALLALLVGAGAPAFGQTFGELRVSSTGYRFVDVNHTFASSVMVDALYLGVSGQDELYLGAGYMWKTASWLTVTPLVYAVAGAQKSEVGLVVGAYTLVETRRVRALAFLGRFVRLGGGVGAYDFLDSLDATAVFGDTWEAGASATVYRQRGDWSSLVGPMVKRTDAHGSWALSVRGGYDTEVRLTRIIKF